MGQYRQWLYYREIEQNLTAQLQALEIELAQLEEGIHVSEQALPLARNEIISALAMNYYRQMSSAEVVALPSIEEQRVNPIFDEPLEDQVPVEIIQITPDTIQETPLQPALQAWGGLPNFGPEVIQPEITSISQASSANFPAIPHSPHPELELLPEDISMFFEEHDERTAPQVVLPWWLERLAVSTEKSDGLIDQESIRTNQLVQRWLERWGRQTVKTNRPGEDQSR